MADVEGRFCLRLLLGAESLPRCLPASPSKFSVAVVVDSMDWRRSSIWVLVIGSADSGIRVKSAGKSGCLLSPPPSSNSLLGEFSDPVNLPSNFLLSSASSRRLLTSLPADSPPSPVLLELEPAGDPGLSSWEEPLFLRLAALNGSAANRLLIKSSGLSSI